MCFLCVVFFFFWGGGFGLRCFGGGGCRVLTNDHQHFSIVVSSIVRGGGGVVLNNDHQHFSLVVNTADTNQMTIN